MTKEIFLAKWVTDCAMVVDLEAVIATEVAKAQEQPSSQVKFDNSFERERFEAMFRAVVVSIPNATWDSTIKITQEGIDKLDAFYAEKEKGGNNG